ncbi:MAG: galactitol-1-phosphate 5-dehydrogenase [candidate division KSB1 bacterium]|nr:galactitol-1-phosphate 5-dehydrogenase [candidate division KSB1 bacterium]
MKALVLTDYRKLVYQDVEDPVPADDEVLVRIKACGICGSDVHGWDGSTGRRIPPLIMGHEAAGVIVAVGRNVRNWRIGERVTFDSTVYRLDDWYTRRGRYNLSDGRRVLGVSTPEYRRNGAFAELLNVPQQILYRLPENVSFEQAALVEPFAVAFHAVRLTPLELGEAVVVVGAGVIGLCLIRSLRLRGCGSIWAVDIDASRLDLAREFGADQAFLAQDPALFESIRAQTEGRGADAAFDAVGISSSFQTAVACVRRGATITLVGNLALKIDLPLQAVVTQELRLQGSCAIAGEYPAVLAKLAAGDLLADRLISVRAPLAEGAAWFERLYRKEQGLLKVVLIP